MMDRRDFLRASALTAVATAAGSAVGGRAQAAETAYRLRYAPRLDFLGDKPIPERLEFFASYGFRATEYNGLMGLPLPEVEQIRKKLDELGMDMGIFVINQDGWNKPLGNSEFRQSFIDNVKKAIDYHKVIGNRCATVITGNEWPSLSRQEQKQSVIEGLKFGCEVLEGTDLTMVVEPLNTLVNHKGYFLSTSAEAAEIIDAVGSPHCKILFDIYHQQITEGNLINNIRTYWDQIGYFQTGDVPGRKEPGTGEINYRNVFKAIYDKGYRGIVGMEHGLSQAGEAGLAKCFEEYRRADNF